MEFKAKLNKPFKPFDGNLDYDESLHDVNSLLMDLCAFIAESSESNFNVSGFGDKKWPVDIETDYCTFLEQLPKAITNLLSGRLASIDFYEQGIERYLEFSQSEKGVLVICKSLTIWQPDKVEQQISRVQLQHVWLTMYVEFISYVQKYAPSAAKHPWFERWATLDLSRVRLERKLDVNIFAFN